MILNKDEQALISAIRESGVNPVAVMMGTRNSFRENDQSGVWKKVVDVWDKYIEEFLDYSDEEIV